MIRMAILKGKKRDISQRADLLMVTHGKTLDELAGNVKKRWSCA